MQISAELWMYICNTQEILFQLFYSLSFHSESYRVKKLVHRLDTSNISIFCLFLVIRNLFRNENNTKIDLFMEIQKYRITCLYIGFIFLIGLSIIGVKLFRNGEKHVWFIDSEYYQESIVFGICPCFCECRLCL